MRAWGADLGALPAALWLRLQAWPADAIFAALAGLRLLISVLLVLEVPRLESHDGFYFHHGGDQDYYFEYALVLLRGSYARLFSVNMGQPAMLAAFSWLLHGLVFEDVLTIAVLVNGFLLAGLSVILVGRLALELTSDRLTAIFAAGLWAGMPWLLWLAFGLHPNAVQLRMPYVPGVAWLHTIADGPALFFSLLGMYYTARTLRQPDLAAAVLAGIAFGVSLLFRIQFVILLLVALLALAIGRRWLAGCAALACAALAYVPQVVYNRLASMQAGMPGVIPWLPGYVYFGLIDPVSAEVYWSNPKLNVFVLVASAGTGIWMGGVVLLALALLAVLAAACVRALGAGRALLLLGGIPGSIGITLFTAIYWQNLFRFTLPAIPILSILVGWGASLLWQRYAAAPRAA